MMFGRRAARGHRRSALAPTLHDFRRDREFMIRQNGGWGTHFLRVMDILRALTGGTQCIATSAPLPFNTRHDPAAPHRSDSSQISQPERKHALLDGPQLPHFRQKQYT